MVKYGASLQSWSKHWKSSVGKAMQISFLSYRKFQSTHGGGGGGVDFDINIHTAVNAINYACFTLHSLKC